MENKQPHPSLSRKPYPFRSARFIVLQLPAWTKNILQLKKNSRNNRPCKLKVFKSNQNELELINLTARCVTKQNTTTVNKRRRSVIPPNDDAQPPAIREDDATWRNNCLRASSRGVLTLLFFLSCCSLLPLSLRRRRVTETRMWQTPLEHRGALDGRCSWSGRKNWPGFREF